MAERTSILTDVAQVAEAAGNEGVSGSTGPSAYRRHSNLEGARRARQRARRIEAMSLKLAGFSTVQIAERMGIQPDTVRKLINRTLATAENRAAEQMRELENSRLDRAQAAIWSQVLAGDYRAVMVFLQISQRRAKLNGLDSPAPVVISPNVRGEWNARYSICNTWCCRVRLSWPRTDQTDDPFDMLLDDEWDVEPGEDGDIRDPECTRRPRPSMSAHGRHWALTFDDQSDD
jgi:hypothetical protein